MAGTRLDALPAEGSPTAAHTVPAVRPDGTTVKLTVQQLADIAKAQLLDGAPEAMDTLRELSAALGDDADFAATMVAALAGKQDALGYVPPDRTAMVGMVVGFPTLTPPAGWMRANGALVLRTDFPELWAFAQASSNLHDEATWAATHWGGFSTGNGATTFRIPDRRAEFQRALDDGRGTDVGRTIGSAQGFATEDHTHTTPVRSSTGGSQTGDGFMYGSLQSSTGGMATGAAATETRPRNIADLMCIYFGG